MRYIDYLAMVQHGDLEQISPYLTKQMRMIRPMLRFVKPMQVRNTKSKIEPCTRGLQALQREIANSGSNNGKSGSYSSMSNELQL